MKKMKWVLVLALCVAMLMTSCATAESDTATPADAATAAPVEATEVPAATPGDAEEAVVTPDDATEITKESTLTTTSTDGKEIYAEQIARYTTALTEQWDIEKYYDNDMCEMVESYYEGNALENVGVAFPDLDFDGKPELVIGGIYNSENDPAIFEIWTTDDNGTPVMVAQSHSRARYYVDYDEAGAWFIDYEASNSAFSHGVYFYVLQDHSLALMQAIVYDGNANPDAPYYMSYDEDWDVSNDESIDEDTFNNIWKSHYNKYEVFDYTPFSEL